MERQTQTTYVVGHHHRFRSSDLFTHSLTKRIVCPPLELQIEFSYYVCDSDGHVVYLGIRLYSLEGSIPTEIGALTNMNHIQLMHNALDTSTVPTELGMLSQMTYLMLTQNSLTGALVSSCCVVAHTHS